MAIKRDDRYPGRWNPADADYPLGGPKNRTTPSAKDGTYFEKDWIADYEAFFGKLISDAGIAPSNVSDTAQLSQFHDAFIAALSVENRLKSNQNFNVEGADGHISSAPQNFTVGQEFSKGRFVIGSDLVNATYTGGLINADSGSYYVEYKGDFTSDFYGIKLADDSIVQTGVTISLATGNTRITVDMSVAQAHKFAGLSEQVGVWPDINDIDSGGSEQIAKTGTATFANATQNINLPGVGDLDGLEIGDVIQVSDSISNNNEFTVESITDSNNIIVNYEHRGQTTTKALIDETSTANVTVRLLCKWYNAPTGLGQDWCQPTSGRVQNQIYTNTLNRDVHVNIVANGNAQRVRAALKIDGNVVSANSVDNITSDNYATASAPVSNNSNYVGERFVGTVTWFEKR